jgi:hypothetical protein
LFVFSNVWQGSIETLKMKDELYCYLERIVYPNLNFAYKNILDAKNDSSTMELSSLSHVS